MARTLIEKIEFALREDLINITDGALYLRYGSGYITGDESKSFIVEDTSVKEGNLWSRHETFEEAFDELMGAMQRKLVPKTESHTTA